MFQIGGGKSSIYFKLSNHWCFNHLEFAKGVTKSNYNLPTIATPLISSRGPIALTVDIVKLYGVVLSVALFLSVIFDPGLVGVRSSVRRHDCCQASVNNVRHMLVQCNLCCSEVIYEKQAKKNTHPSLGLLLKGGIKNRKKSDIVRLLSIPTFPPSTDHH